MSNRAHRVFSEAVRYRNVVPAAVGGAAVLLSAVLSMSDKNGGENTQPDASIRSNSTRHTHPSGDETSFSSKMRDVKVFPGRHDISLPLPLLALSLTPSITSCDFFTAKPRQSIRRRRTIKRLQDTKTRAKLEHRYTVQWNRPLGEGGFGSVYLGTDKKTGEMVAIKKISKKHTNDTTFQQEMNAFHQIRMNGNHPNICGLRENFDEGQYFYLVMDLISGGEVFDRLIEKGAYSEADAARLVREVGSALAFLHGIGLVHGDLKPENLMCTTANLTDAVTKIVDFGCAEVIDPKSPFYDADEKHSVTNTPGYSPPEVLDNSRKCTKLEPSVDMFAVGVIIYIILTGMHPFDLSGESTEKEMSDRVRNKQAPPLRNSTITEHLSPSAIDLIERLIQWNPKKRMTAQEMLEHPWVRGVTATKAKIADSDKRLKSFRKYKSKLEAKVFASMVQWSDSSDEEHVAKKTSLIERSFQMLDSEHRGYITTSDLEKLDPKDERVSSKTPEEDSQLSLSGFSDLLAENMKNKYFPAGHVIYHEGERGHNMYFINSGRVEVSTKDGFKTVTEQGDFFGEGALLNKTGRRNATIKCLTPVHAIEISKDYFEKYLKDGYDTALSLKEKSRMRQRSRAQSILTLQKSLKEHTLQKGEYVYEKGESGNNLYLVQEGAVDVKVGNHTVFTSGPGGLCGEYTLIFGRPRNTSAICVSDQCRLQSMEAKDFDKLARSNPYILESLREMALRRQFQKAMVFATNKSFPTKVEELRHAFQAADYNGSGKIDLSDVAVMLRKMDPTFTDKDIAEILNSLDLDDDGAVKWEEFKRVFGMSGTRFSSRY
ncbi:serine/threonine protein kinase [Nitzschia inconspicua]|uniref:Serine/threonine protein kinase n=1 Tax=Nitzschia inconspicua TaxID=303405 RepID=A0A9K3LGF2_9STRA|nr:serine/threonine protein kinase [Nitzschia inconspicua]